jgi:hypothetical protein
MVQPVSVVRIDQIEPDFLSPLPCNFTWKEVKIPRGDGGAEVTEAKAQGQSNRGLIRILKISANAKGPNNKKPCQPLSVLIPMPAL